MENFSLFSGQKSESVENTNSLFLCAQYSRGNSTEMSHSFDDVPCRRKKPENCLCEPYEVDKILGNMGISRMNVETELTEGTNVKIIAGPFNGMYGKVDSVDMPNQKVMLLVDLFGQETSVEVELGQIENA